MFLQFLFLQKIEFADGCSLISFYMLKTLCCEAFDDLLHVTRIMFWLKFIGTSFPSVILDYCLYGFVLSGA